MDNRLVVFWKKNYFTSSFFGKNAKKKNFLEDKWFLSKMFSQIKMQAATNLKKHQTFDFFKRQIFNAIFKNYMFLVFENHL